MAHYTAISGQDFRREIRLHCPASRGDPLVFCSCVAQRNGLFDRAGVFWAGVSVSPELRLLEKHVTAATSQCGFAAEDRPYHPHVTLARAKGDDRIRTLRKLQARVKQEVEFPPFTTREFLLYESFLDTGGPRHQVRERFPLGAT
jgi:2'-5' RNA ligase